MSALASVEEYRKALRSMELAHAIGDVQWKWLREHCRAPRQTLSTMELARIAGYETHGGVNLHYGRFGFDLAAHLRWSPSSDQPHFACAFVTFSDPDPDAPDTRWHLRPEVLSAIQQLGWFGLRPSAA